MLILVSPTLRPGQRRMLIHIFNGHALSVIVDDDPANRQADGLISVQVHVGPPMKVEFRAIRLKKP